MATLEQYNSWRTRLLSMIEKTMESAKDLSPEKASLYGFLYEQLKNDALKIQVVGTVKNGKSSFTNALIGEMILPVDDIPCTAVVSEVKYDAEKRAVVNFCSPLPTGLLDEIPPKTKEYILSHGMGKDSQNNDVRIPPIEVPYDEMNRYVAIPEPTPDILFDEEAMRQYKEKIDQESPFDVAELYYPAPLLKDGVMLVDSPGLNESPRRTAVALDYLKKADAAIYLLDATKPATSEEKKVIENVLLPLGFNDLIMVANRIDLVTRRERQRLYCQGQVQGYTSIKQCFGVSAKEALEAMRTGNRELLEQSGMPGFTAFLTDYLTRKKGELKIKKTAMQIVNSVRHDLLENLIPAQLNALEADSVSLQKRINEATPRLTQLEANRSKMAQTLERNIPLALTPVGEAIKAFFKKLEDDIPEWISAYQPKTDVGFVANKKDLQNVAEETLGYAKDKVNEAYRKWNEGTFQPLLMEQFEMVFGSLKEDMKNIADQIASIEGLLKGLSDEAVDSSTTMERIAGIAAMLFLPLGRSGGDLFAGGFDLSNFLKNFAVDLGIGLGVGLIALWVWPPLGFIATCVGVMVGLLQGNDRKIRETKKKLYEKIVEDMKNDTPRRVSDIVSEIRETFDSIKDSVLQGLDSEIDTVRRQLDELRQLISDEQNSIDRKRALLTEAGAGLSSATEEMLELVGEVDSVN